MKNKSSTFQEWLPIKKILENGIILLENNSYIKIIKIFPINYNLKSELEKAAILNSYKIFLKTCNFEIQVLIQSSKEDLSKHLLKIEKESTKEENKKIKSIYSKYTKFIKEKNQKKESSNKNFLILIKNPQNNNQNLESLEINNLNDKYYKIKECLSRCGNIVQEYNKKENVIEILHTFFNYRKKLLLNK